MQQDIWIKIKTNYGGVKLSNPSYVKYYKGMI